MGINISKASEIIWGGVGGAIVGAVITILLTGFMSSLEREAKTNNKEQILAAKVLVQEEIRAARAKESEYLLSSVTRAESASQKASLASEITERTLASLRRQEEIVADIVSNLEEVSGSSTIEIARALLPEIKQELSKTQFPSGSVVAFRSIECPEELGWIDFEAANGRAIIGVGSGDGLSTRKLLEIGGAENHTLSINEMPRHNHGGPVGGDGTKYGMNNSYRNHNANNKVVEFEGGGEPHNNMQPFVALRYCIRR